MASKTEMSIILKAIDAASGAFNAVEGKVGKLAKKAEKVGKSMTASLTAPALALGVASVHAAGAFEKGMSDVSTLIDTNVESMDEMSRKVLDMSTNAGEAAVPLGDMTGALFSIRSAGVEAGDSLSVLSKSAKLGVAGLGSTAQAADLGTSAINAFGLKGEAANRAYEIFFLTTKKGKTTIAELSQGFGGVAGTVAANNIELDEFAAITASLTTTGLKASEAYTQQKAVLSGLTRVTKDSRKVFKKLGVKDFPELVKKSGGFRAAIMKVSDSVDGNKGKLLKLLGSTEALSAVLAITGDQGKDAARTLDEMRSSSGQLEEAFAKQNATAAAGLQRMKNSLNAAAISMGKVLGPVAAKVSGIITRAANAFEALDDDTKEWIATIAAVIAVVGPLILISAKMVTAIVTIKGAVLGAAAAFKVLRGSSADAGEAMAGAGGKAGGVLGKLGRFAGAAGGVAAVATAAWGLGRALDHAFDLSDKLAGGLEGIADKFADATGHTAKMEEHERRRQIAIEGTLAARRKLDQLAVLGRVLSPEEDAARKAKSLELSRAAGAARAAELAQQGTPGAPGASGTVTIEIPNAPAGTRVTQTDGDAIDLQVGRQVNP